MSKLLSLARVLTAMLLAVFVLAGLSVPAQAATVPVASVAVPQNSGTGQRVVYSDTAQRIWLVRADGAVDRTYRVSGKRNTPRPGTYRVFSKSEKAFSTGGVTMRYMVRFTHGRTMAIGFHDIPRDRRGRPLQTAAQLGSYRSHGCVRQLASDARYLYGWAKIGTKVVVVR